MSETSILERIQAEMIAAMKARDQETLSTLRMLKSALMEAKTKKPKDATLTLEEEIEIVRRYAKKRSEMIEEWRKHGQPERVASEERELAVTGRYLPQALSEEELRAMVRESIAATGASGPKDTGKVIGAVMALAKGRADGAMVSRLVREALAGC